MPAFRQSILSAPFTLDTQLSFTGERDGSDHAERALRGRLDLVLRSQRPPPAVVVVECKVAPDHPVNIAKQIQDYRVRLNSGTFGRSRKTVILLSPYADKHGADLISLGAR
jgi:hypothetical protein